MKKELIYFTSQSYQNNMKPIINFPRRIRARPSEIILIHYNTMTSLRTHGDEELNDAVDEKPGSDHETNDDDKVDKSGTSSTNCEDASESSDQVEKDPYATPSTKCEDTSKSSDQVEKDPHATDTGEALRLHSLVSHYKSRASKLETENTTLKLDLANIRFDLEHCRLELRQMTSKRDALRKEVIDALNSKAALAQNLGRENSEMISTIDKLETERDVLLEEVEQLRHWIIKNKGEGDDNIDEEGDWVATGTNDIFCNGGSNKSVGPVPRPFESTSEDWESARIPQFPTTPVNDKSKDDGAFALGGESTSTPLTVADTFDSIDDKLYSDEYLSLASADNISDNDDDDESFQKSYHGTTKAGQSTGQDDSTVGSINTKETGGSGENDDGMKKKKKKRWGVSVKPRRKSSVPASNFVSQT